MADYTSQQQALNRRRQLAQALQQQSMLPIEMPQTPGANVGWSQGAAKIAEALFGGLINRKLDKQQQSIDTGLMGERLGAAQAAIPYGTGNYDVMPSPAGQPSIMEAPMSPQQQDARSALVRALASSNPQIAQMAQGRVQEQGLERRQGQTQAQEMARLMSQQQFTGLQNAQNQSSEDARAAAQRAIQLQIGMKPTYEAGGVGQTPGIFNPSGAGQFTPTGEAAQSQRADPYGEREVEHDGKVWIQTYDKGDQQGRTLSERVKSPIKPTAGAGSSADSTDYKFHVTEIDKRAKPIDDAAARMNRLTDTIGQNTAQADALIAPELMTVMAGGTGSGLRINEAEINRVQGGRPMVAQLQAKLRAWLGTDQKSAINFGPDERKAINDLVGLVNSKIKQKQSALSEASRKVSEEGATSQQRRSALADLDNALRDIDSGKQQSTSSGPKKGDVQEGYEFLGGDPRKSENWKKR